MDGYAEFDSTADVVHLLDGEMEITDDARARDTGASFGFVRQPIGQSGCLPFWFPRVK